MSDEALDMAVPTQAGTNGQAVGGGDDHLKRFLDETLDSLLRSAQDSASQLIDRAREAAEAEAALSRQLREQAQQEADRMAAWRAEVEPLVDAVNERAKAIQMSIQEAPQRVAAALAPVNSALADVDVVLGRLTEALADRHGNPTGPVGPGGPGGPGGRAFDASVDSGQLEAASFGTLGEVMSADPVPSASADAPSEALSAEALPAEASPEEAAPAETLPVQTFPAETAPAAAVPTLHAVQPEQSAPEAGPAEPAGDGSTAPRWVDWPGDGQQAQAEGAAPTETGDEQAPTAEWSEDSHDEDDAALRSATTQLRRAVTDIDWRDLPSASNG